MSAKMNPDAPHFAPSDLAMVQYGGAVKTSDGEGCPQDLIVHETLKTLIQEVNELKTRASHLERENASLQHVHQENEEIKMQIQLLRRIFVDASAAQQVKANFTGYSASETSSTGEHVLSPDFKALLTSLADLTPDANDADLKKKVEHHQTTVTQILEKFNESLSGETAKREELQKEFTEIQNILRAYKGRTGALESKFKKMAVDMDEIEVAVQDVKNASTVMAVTKNDPGMSPYAQDQIEKLQGNFNAAVRRLKTLEDDVDAHRCVLNEFSQSQEVKSGWAFHNGNGGGSNDDGWASTSANEPTGWEESKSDTIDTAKFQSKLVRTAHPVEAQSDC